MDFIRRINCFLSLPWLYSGERKKRDAPLSLKEMYAEADETIMKYVPDYKVNLIAPEQMTEEEIR